MRVCSFAFGALGTAALCATTQASIITFSQQSVWDAFMGFQSLNVVTEDFNAIPDGFHASGFSGSVDGLTWTATATGGLVSQSGLFSTNDATALSFSFAPGVKGLAGNFFGTDAGFSPVPSLVQVTLNDGTSSILFTSGPTDFAGFYSTGTAIAGVTITAAGAGLVFPTVDNLFFAVSVPSPGAAASIGLAVVLFMRRRDRI